MPDQIPVGDVTAEVEDELGDPRSREDLTALGAPLIIHCESALPYEQRRPTNPPCSQPNNRARDLADLILFEELLAADGLAAVRAACVDVFTARDERQWPPVLVAPAHWATLWSTNVTRDRFFITGLNDAVARVRTFIARIDAG